MITETANLLRGTLQVLPEYVGAVIQVVPHRALVAGPQSCRQLAVVFHVGSLPEEMETVQLVDDFAIRQFLVLVLCLTRMDGCKLCSPVCK